MYTVHGKVKLLWFPWRLGWRTVEFNLSIRTYFIPFPMCQFWTTSFKKMPHWKQISLCGISNLFSLFFQSSFHYILGFVWGSQILKQCPHHDFPCLVPFPTHWFTFIKQLFQGPILGWWITGKLYNKAITLCSNYLCWKKIQKMLKWNKYLTNCWCGTCMKEGHHPNMVGIFHDHRGFIGADSPPLFEHPWSRCRGVSRGATLCSSPEKISTVKRSIIARVPANFIDITRRNLYTNTFTHTC